MAGSVVSLRKASRMRGCRAFCAKSRAALRTSRSSAASWLSSRKGSSQVKVGLAMVVSVIVVLCGKPGAVEGSRRRCLTAYVPVAEHDPLLAGQAFEADRAAGVDLVGRDADFGTQAVFETIGEARRGIDHHRARIDFAQETHGLRVVFGDDGLAVVRRVLVDVLDGFVRSEEHTSELQSHH